MCKGQVVNSEWWEVLGYFVLQDGLFQDLVDDFCYFGVGEDVV